MGVLVDTSIWIDFFRGGRHSRALDALLDEDEAVTNDLILAELIPALVLRGERRVVAMLRAVQRPPLRIDWPGLVDLQVRCLRRGANGIGIPDLIIAQHALQADFAVYSLDRHFRLLADVAGVRLFAAA